MKRTLTSLVIIGLVALMAGTGTYAWFTSTATSTGNTFTAGTLDIYLTDGQPNPNAQWCIAQGAPGESQVHNDIRIHNLGSLDGNHVEIRFDLDEYEDNDGNLTNGCAPGPDSDSNLTGTGDMASELKVETMEYTVVVGGVSTQIIDLVWYNGKYKYNHTYLTDWNDNGYIDLDDLKLTTLDDLPAPKALDAMSPDYTDYTEFDMAVSLIDTGFPQNDFQGDIIDMTVKVTLNQDESQ